MIPNQVLTGIVDQLKPEDSLGVVLFSDGACTPRALSSMKGADVAELKRRVGGRSRSTGVAEAVCAWLLLGRLEQGCCWGERTATGRPV